MANKFDNKNLSKALEKIGKESVSYLAQLLQQNGKNATGELINSLDYNVVKDIEGLILIIESSDYFKYVDKGRKKGATPPPLKAILPWVKVKHIQFRNKDNGRFMTYKQTAYMVQQGISKNGIKALNAKKKLDTWIENNKDKIVKAAGDDIQVYLNKIFYTSV